MRKRVFLEGANLRQLQAATAGKAIVSAPAPTSVVLFVGEMEVLIKTGAAVKIGQKLAHSKALLTVPVHASIAGTVKTIDELPHPGGGLVRAVVIENDGSEATDTAVRKPDWQTMAPDALREAIFNAGIALPPFASEPAGPVVVNCTASEPTVTADYRLMLERAADIVAGLAAVLRAVGAERGTIVVDKQEKEAVQAMQKALPSDGAITLTVLNNRYPPLAEKLLRQDVFGGKPLSGLITVLTASEAVAVSDFVRTGLPYVERTVTVVGSGVQQPGNFRVKIGTRCREVLAAAAEIDSEIGQIILGGPLTGTLAATAEIPITQETAGILALAAGDVRRDEPHKCVRCGYCVQACPVGLAPLFLGDLVEAGRAGEAAAYNIAECIECGACAYECPAKRPLLHYIQLAKAELNQ